MKIKVLSIKPAKKPEIIDIDSGLKSLQKEVDGTISAVYPFEDPVAIICNDDGKLMGLPLNRALRDECGNIYDVIAGNFLIVGLTEDSFGTLSDDLAEKYSSLFETPEEFFISHNKLCVVPQ